MRITDLLNYEILEDCIKTARGSFYLFRIIPPNLTIMNPGERRGLITRFRAVLESNETPFQILAMDKTEDLSKNKAFWKGTQEKYAFMSDAVVDSINEIEYTGSGIQRAYYMVINPREPQQKKLFENLLSENSFRFQQAQRDELVTVLRNFNLRDFLDFDIYTLEQEVLQQYESQKGAAK